MGKNDLNVDVDDDRMMMITAGADGDIDGEVHGGDDGVGDGSVGDNADDSVDDDGDDGCDDGGVFGNGVVGDAGEMMMMTYYGVGTDDDIRNACDIDNDDDRMWC